MAEAADKVPENQKGKFYVDQQCIDCVSCRDVAPQNFSRADKNGIPMNTNSLKTRRIAGTIMKKLKMSKKKCCEKYKRKGKACKNCPLFK